MTDREALLTGGLRNPLMSDRSAAAAAPVRTPNHPAASTAVLNRLDGRRSRNRRLLGQGDPSKLASVLLELAAVGPEGLLTGQVLPRLEELSHEAHPASIGLVEALSVVVAGLLGGLLIRGLALVENQDGLLHPRGLRQELRSDRVLHRLELHGLGALGPAHLCFSRLS